MGRVRRGHGHNRALNRDRTGHVLSQVLGREVLEGRRRRRELLCREEWHALLDRDRPRHVVRRDRPHIDEDVADAGARCLGATERFLEHFAIDDALVQEDPSQRTSCSRGLVAVYATRAICHGEIRRQRSSCGSKLLGCSPLTRRTSENDFRLEFLLPSREPVKWTVRARAQRVGAIVLALAEQLVVVSEASPTMVANPVSPPLPWACWD